LGGRPTWQEVPLLQRSCGWGWRKYTKWGTITEYHWQQDELHHVVFQTLFAIDEGGEG